METGIRHEKEALIWFQDKFGDECFVVSSEEDRSRNDDIKIRFEQTLKAMEEGKKVIYHGILVGKEKENGETDFLFRIENDGKGRFGSYHYEVGDAKSSRSSKFCQQMQVTFYSWLLQAIQGVRPQCGMILTRPLGIGNEPIPFREELFLIDDYIWTLKSFLEEEIQEILEKKEIEFFFNPNRLCGTCLYYEYCLGRAGASNDLSLIPDIRKIQKRHLNNAGVQEINALADAKDPVLKIASKATGVTFEGLRKLRLQAQSMIKDEPVPRGVFDFPRDACMAMTDSELDLPGDKERTTSIDFTDKSLVHVYFDMESDPYSSVEYLFGVMADEPGKRGRRKKGETEFFTAESYAPEAEYEAFNAFLKRMDQIRRNFGDEGFAVFHYAHYEPAHLTRLAAKYIEKDPGLIDKVDYLNRRMVDLYKLIKKTYYMPVASYSIKDVAPCVKDLMGRIGQKGGHEWKKIKSVEELEKELKKGRWTNADIGESINEVREAIKRFGLEDEAMVFDASAEMSVVWFNLFIERKKKVWMKLIEIYNEDDLIATRSLVDWLLFMQKQQGR